MRDPFIQVPFASGGDTSTIPTNTQPTGSISMQQGWGADYQKEVGVEPGAKSVDRQDMNELFNLVTTLLNRWQTEAFPEWIDPASNAGAPYLYPLGVIVRVVDPADPSSFVLRISTKNENASVPEFATETTDWPDPLPGMIGGNVPDASMTVAGIIRIATLLESNGTSETLAVSPAGLQSLRDRLAFLEARRGLGFGQVITTFTNVERPPNTFFLNSTLNPKEVSVIQSPGGNIAWVIDVQIGATSYVVDLASASGPTNVLSTVKATVPVGASYRIRITSGSATYTVQEMATP